jgi:hypothetical protein
MKLTGKRSAGNPHATFDEAEAGNVLKTLSGAPVFDPTDEGELEIEHAATTPVLYSTGLNNHRPDLLFGIICKILVVRLNLDIEYK